MGVVGHLLVASQWLLAFPFIRLCSISHPMEVRVDEKAGFSYSTHVSTKRAHCQMGRPGDQLVGGRGLPTVLLICRYTQPSGPAENILNFVIISFFSLCIPIFEYNL